MLVVDLNLLLYAVNADAPRHSKARAWWEGTLNGDEEVGLAWPVVLGFLRLTTRSGILPRPLTPRQALDSIDEWIAHPQVVMLDPGAGHWAILSKFIDSSGAAGNLTTDAHLAALAVEYGATLYSTYTDFTRFAALKFRNPLD